MNSTEQNQLEGNKLIEDRKDAVDFFDQNKEAAKRDQDAAIDLYKRYVGSAETQEERLRRINKFRCG